MSLIARGKAPAIALDEFFGSCTNIHPQTHLSFSSFGRVEFTTLTRANLELLRRAEAIKAPGLIISCPDFERESLAITFLGALQHIDEADERNGRHEPQCGEKCAVGRCVIKITGIKSDRDIEYVMYESRDESNVGLRRDMFPKVHKARQSAKLTKTGKGRGRLRLMDAESEYEDEGEGVRAVLDKLGGSQPAIGYITSPSQYVNEAPTRILSGQITVDNSTTQIYDVLPVSRERSNGQRNLYFKWPFDVCSSIIVCPRVDGVGKGYPLLDYARNPDNKLDFVSMNIPSPEFLNAGLLSDILDFADEGISVVGFCDRWTLDNIGQLKERGFLVFDWDDCALAELAPVCRLSSVQKTMRRRHPEKIVAVHEGSTRLSEAKEILYEELNQVELYTDDALQAKGILFRAFSSAIRRTEILDDESCLRQIELINDAVETIEETRALTPEAFERLCTAREILRDLYKPGVALPKEDQMYDLLTNRIEEGRGVILVVDRSRTEHVHRYWTQELEYNGYKTDGFRVINTLEFMAGKGISGDEAVFFSGWYDRGTMDRAVHSGIAADITFVLYHDGKGGLEVGWWKKAKETWRKASDRCTKETDSTLKKLGIEPTGRKQKYIAAYSGVKPIQQVDEGDDSPAHLITEVEKQLLREDAPRSGERAVEAIPVLFEDGSHIWLRDAGGDKGGGGTLLVITDCLVDQDDDPVRKPASAVLRGDMVLVPHSSRQFIRELSEERLSNYDEVRAIASRWREPILEARKNGMRDADIARKIQDHMRSPKSGPTIRGWVLGNRIAPREESDIRAIYAAFGKDVSDREVALMMRAAKRIRGQHMRTGFIANERIVKEFIADVRKYGVDGAVEGFEKRHSDGSIELLAVTAVGKKMQVSADRVEIY